MDSAFEDKVIEALDAYEDGESVERILSRYPARTPALRPILEVAAGLGQAPPTPSPAAKSESRRRLLERAEDLRAAEQHSPREIPLWRRFLVSLASAAATLILIGTLAVLLSPETIPGDALYPLKRTVEDARLYLAPAGEKNDLRQQFEKERNSEVYRMLQAGRDGRAGYAGELKAHHFHVWEIGNITVHIMDETVIEGRPVVGARVEAHCRIEDGRVFAESLRVLPPESS